MFVLNQFVLQHLFHIGASGVQLRQAIDNILRGNTPDFPFAGDLLVFAFVSRGPSG
jgi:hypothetical protein